MESDGDDSFVALQIGLGTKNVRSLIIYAVQEDGSIAKVNMQVTSISDYEGNAFDFESISSTICKIEEETKLIKEILNGS